MNGRFYDPVLGRMLSPDNFVQDPDNTQSYNRYSYANNNPLKYTDPDGNFPFLIATAIIVVSTIVGSYLGGVATNEGELNPRNWDWSAPSTYFGIGFGGILGYVGGWYLANPATLTWAIGIGGSAGSAYLVGAGSDWNFEWTTIGGGGGSIPLNSKGSRNANEVVSEQINIGLRNSEDNRAAVRDFTRILRRPSVEVGDLQLGGYWYDDPAFDDFSGIFVYEMPFEINLSRTIHFMKNEGISLPPFVIIVGKGSDNDVKQHEYGHYLDYKKLGFQNFYTHVGIPSLLNSWSDPSAHRFQWYEKSANNSSRNHYGKNTTLTNLTLWCR